MKMSDVFPLDEAPIPSWVFALSLHNNKEQMQAAAHAINNHDRLTAENDELQAEVERLRKHNDELQRYNVGLAESELELQQERDQLKAQVNGMRQALDELVDHSFGVAGLHLNGEVAKWGDLMGDGRFCEWLAVFDDTPEQCLAARDAKVLERFVGGIINCIKAISPEVSQHKNTLCIRELKTFRDSAIERGVDSIQRTANQLRQQAKG